MQRRDLLGDLLCGHEILGDVMLLQKLIDLESCLVEGLGELMLCDASLSVELDKSRFLGKSVEVGVVSPQLLFHIGGEIKRDRHSEVSSWRVKPWREVYTSVHYFVKGLGTIRRI